MQTYDRYNTQRRIYPSTSAVVFATVLTFSLLLTNAFSADWSWSGNADVTEVETGVRITMAATGYLPPHSCTVTKTLATTSSGLIGIRICAESGQPMAAVVTVSNDSSECSCYVTDEWPGEGNTRTLLLNNTDGWTGNTTALQNPRTLSVYVRQGSTQKEIYQIQNLFTGCQPTGTSQTLTNGNGVRLRWEHLNPELCYDVLHTDDLSSGQWSHCQTLNHPSDSVLNIDIATDSSECGFYKLRVRGD